MLLALKFLVNRINFWACRQGNWVLYCNMQKLISKQYKFKMNNKIHAYSLIELIVVMAIITVLMVTGYTIIQIAYKRARDIPRIKFLRAVQTGIEAYRASHHDFPTCDTGTDLASLHVGDFDHACYISNLGAIKHFFDQGYKSPLPQGKSTTNAMAYYLNNSNNTYVLCTLLESKYTDNQKPQFFSAPSGANAGGCFCLGLEEVSTIKCHGLTDANGS